MQEDIFDFDSELKAKTKYIENVMKLYLPKEEGFQENIIKAMNYSVFAPGKRIRPMLMKETYELLAYDNTYNYQALEIFMVAIELLHAYSLVHDDLPALDNDELRRGIPTTHVKYGEAAAILAGDGILNYAYELVAKAFEVGADTQCIIKSFKILSEKAGIYGMLGGQAVDVETAGMVNDVKKLNFIYELKTGAFIEASMMIGAILAGVNDETVEKVKNIASDIGLAFQIQDDILDVTSTTDVLGKPVNSDEKNEKSTYVTLHGIDISKEYVGFYSERALQGIKELDGYNKFLNELVIRLVKREK
ncbi:MAG: polyprenyl synthetase family protein [Lachnospiraceae bacterium]|nr:polyprenyl synthetase family protein [Lachnospiraceae bacterium]